jgi:hypothetical protein
MAMTTGAVSFAHGINPSLRTQGDDEPLFYRYPALNDEQVSAVVGSAHTNLEKVKELVTNRPELACASWDWGFGDWETALGAASHMGRKDIAEFLMSYGARPDLFTYTMMGEIGVVKSIIEASPGIQRHPGPHGITLLQHAKNRLRVKDLSAKDIASSEQVITYLETLGDADPQIKTEEITETEKTSYQGVYRYGDAENEIFEITLNMRGMLQIGRKGQSGRPLNKIENQLFFPSGSPSVQIRFEVKDGVPVSLTIYEPEPVVTAIRV